MTVGRLRYVKDDLCPKRLGVREIFSKRKMNSDRKPPAGKWREAVKSGNHDQILVVLTGLKYTHGIYNTQVVLWRILCRRGSQ